MFFDNTSTIIKEERGEIDFQQNSVSVAKSSCSKKNRLSFR